MSANLSTVVLLVSLLFSSPILAKDEPPLNNSKKIEGYRRDFIINMLTNIPFRLPMSMKMNLQNAEPLEDDTVMFYLYTRTKPYDSIIVNQDVSEIDPQNPVKILIHGWTEHYYAEWCKKMTAAYLRRGDYNVIVTDWSKKGDTDYLSASYSVPQVGQTIGDFISNRLHKEIGISLRKIHLIGHSLGGHVSGLTGQRVLKSLGHKIGRITALDPAAPIFDFISMSTSDRLSPDDANFVDIVHTDAGFLGFKNSLGVVDFYPNAGKAFQPGCDKIRGYEDLFCSHAKSYKLFTYSLMMNNLTALKCQSWERFDQGQCSNDTVIPFGENTPMNITGTYFLRTPEGLS